MMWNISVEPPSPVPLTEMLDGVTQVADVGGGPPTLLAAATYQTVLLVDLADDRVVGNVDYQSTGFITGLVARRWGRSAHWLALATADRTVRLFSFGRRSSLHLTMGTGQTARALAWTADGHLALGLDDGVAVVELHGAPPGES